MIRLLPFCIPITRRGSRPIRRVARPAGVATVAKIASVPVTAGLVCFMLPVWGGGVPVVPAPVAAARPLPSSSIAIFAGALVLLAGVRRRV